MKKIFLIVFATLIYSTVFSQTTKPSRPEILYSSKTNYLSYVGRMNDELWSLLNEKEISLYDSCLSKLGLTRETVKWYSHELFNNLITDNYYCSVKIVSLKTDSSLNDELNSVGKNKLDGPECILVVTRIPGRIDEVAIHMYF